MAPPLAELTAHAQTLTSAGDLAGARDVLADALDPADADPQRASADLALAAALQARILIALGDPHGARTWAGFAHAAEERLHGPHDERTIAAAATHAAVLQRVGNHGRAAQLYHDLVGELAAQDGPLSARVLAAEADLATAEHAAGQCTAARNRLADAWTRHRHAHGEDSPAGIKMLARLAAMERECGHTGDALRHFRQVQELCARHLPPDHPLGRQVARLAGAEASGRHVCGRVQRSTGPAPDTPAADTPAADVPAGSAPAPNDPAAGGPAVAAVRVPETAPGVYPVRPGSPAPDEPTGRHARPEPFVALPLDSPEPAQPPPGPVDMPLPPAAEAPPAAAVATRDTPAPHAWTASPSGQPVDYHENQPQSPVAYPEAPAEPAPGAWSGPPPPVPVQQPWPEPAPLPAMAAPARPAYQPAVEPPRERAGESPPGPWPPESFPPVAHPPGTYPPGPRLPVDELAAPAADRRLPVPVDQPERHSTRHPLALAAVLVAGIAAAAAVVVVTWPRDDPAASPAADATAAPSAAASAAPPAASPSARPTSTAVAPAGVTLRDNRDSVLLTWKYPKGSEGPVLISGGRAGQEQRAFQQLPAGTTDYVVYGLNRQNNYCFSVAVVYTVDRVAASDAVCTKR
ncbi:fibronectin type III domain-containing protein [Actinoplanes nipponensis]|uniref:fibronectin type III domain-containing protein n=1 Tax=Actinoplanes nipponensis TaxID=135950 RepID=UPI00194195C9|nr:tetratricopeptide repeat protein [Actinoplanes nipponensis]